MRVPSQVKDIARGLWYVEPGRAEIREEALPPPAAGEVRVRTLHSAVSRGTEALVQAGRVPESEYERMRAPAMAGTFPFPVKYGYASVGRVETGPADLLDRTVFALHPHQSAFNVAVEAAVPLPDDVTPSRAVLAANMETALNAVWDSSVGPADRIAVIGAGVVGALVSYLCGGIVGADVTLIDIDPSRAGIAQALGIKFAAPARAPRDCDAVFHTSGNAQGLATAIELAGNEATIIEMSWYGSGAVGLPLGGAFHSRRLKLMSSQVGQVSPSRRPRWTHKRRLAAALALLADPKLDVLLAPPIAFNDLPAQLPRILKPGSGVLCQIVNY
ncbi:zinc-binding alcohol dehydrogenase [Bradyrhizobium sp. LHD-71]|uniref:zinc-dependent alcohol dehydrogenase n=1 Tax=Bradyrhizobium sp. LHD-71 TaxID=3072141 RepID=UPI00280DC32A|nr:zinc-binding alcohol dehydrogenase [Bradyrhizobium sp. LHD-71]MDQ8730272.1 zinc-binding alcohol dehydrogenase [Bradyrhizobium sp. LHD-71]